MESYLDYIPLEVGAIVASYLSLIELNVLCESNYKLCETSQFWIQLITNRFGNIPKQITGNINYKKLYRNVSEYVEYRSTPVDIELINKDMMEAIDSKNRSPKYNYIYMKLIQRMQRSINVGHYVKELLMEEYPKLYELSKEDVLFLLNMKLLTTSERLNLIYLKYRYDADIILLFIDNYDYKMDFVLVMRETINKIIEDQKNGKLDILEVRKWAEISDKISKKAEAGKIPYL